VGELIALCRALAGFKGIDAVMGSILKYMYLK